MLYLAAQILLCLVAAFLLGAVIAWLPRGSAATRRIAANDELWIKETEQRRLHQVQAERELTSKTAEVTALQHEFEGQKALNARLEKEVSQTRGLQDALAEARGKISELRPLTEQLREREREARMTERERDLLRARMDDLNTVIHEQQAALDAKNEHVVKLCRQIEQLEPLSSEIQLRNLTIAELQTRLRKAERERKRGGNPPTTTTPSGKDDLKLIHGIGTKLEKLLNRLGYERFEQLASWTSDDIDVVDEKLEAFRGRIRRDNWVDQAKHLLEERKAHTRRLQTRGKPIALARR